MQPLIFRKENILVFGGRADEVKMLLNMTTHTNITTESHPPARKNYQIGRSRSRVQAKWSSDLYQHWIATFSGRRRLRKSISGNLINFIRSDRCFVKLFAQQSVGGDVGGGLTVCKTVRVWLYVRVECFITSEGDSNAVEASPGLVTLPLYHDLPARAKVAMNYRSWWWLI